jgi:four helix bundle suffix protein
VARGSLEELLLDYEDFLRQRELKKWEKESKEALFVRKIGKQEDRSYRTYKTYLETRPAEVCANILICLIHQANYLLDQQLKALETDFLEDGGFTERLYNSRRRKRGEG